MATYLVIEYPAINPLKACLAIVEGSASLYLSKLECRKVLRTKIGLKGFAFDYTWLYLLLPRFDYFFHIYSESKILLH